MRADRLVATLLLLQARGQVTAAEVAEELEVSERTARRDLDALGMAGVPVYSIQGRGGGWRLAGSGRTDLTGLNDSEVRALFLLVGSVDGVTADVRAALRKLLSALPAVQRERAEATGGTLLIDPSDWDRRRADTPVPTHLDAVQQAVVDREQIRIEHVGRNGSTRRVVHPLGLATKGRHWYLLTDTDDGSRTFRVDRITVVEPIGEPAHRPDEFDLEQRWSEVLDRLDELRAPVVARAVAGIDVLEIAGHVFGSRLVVDEIARAGEADPDVASVEIRGHSVESLVAELAPFGDGIQVESPPELRSGLAALGATLVSTYAERPGDT